MMKSLFHSALRHAELTPRAQQIFTDHMQQLHQRIDRMFVVLMFAQWAFAVLCAAILTPFNWIGNERHIHPHVWLAVLLGGLLAIPAARAGLLYPGRRATRNLIALCQVGFSSLLIHVTGGRIETHFHVFGSLAFLAAYRDWTVLMPPTIFVAGDHLVRGLFWPESVFGVITASNWRWLEHAGWVLFEDLWLIICCRQGLEEVRNIARHSAELEESHAEIAKQSDALEEVLHQRSAILAGALDAIVQLDDHGRIVSWNTQATEIFGWTEDEVIGRPLAETIVPPCNPADPATAQPRLVAGDLRDLINRRIEMEAVRRNGKSFPIELAITPIPAGERISFCAFLRDISERRQSQERLLQAKESAEAANQAKSLFLANMSHEIRTPLNAIMGFTDLIRTSDDLSAIDRNSYLEAVHKSGSHLLSVINDILDLSKIEAGQMEYERIRFSPHQVIVDVLSLMRVQAGEKGITLDARWLGRVPETIYSDPARMRQLLLNLVGNAIKFTERGSVQILARLDAAKELLQLEVIDTGVGIPPEKLELIFTPFVQADASVTRRFGGTGLGLSICRYIANGLGGAVSAQSCVGQGSTFTATIASGPLTEVKLLDRPPCEALAEGSASASVSRTRLNGLQILIVDDGETNRRLLSLLLTRAGATVTTAEDGLEAVQKATHSPFHAILMDMQMPIMDGYSAARELRDRGSTVPIIALTAHAMAGEQQKCRDAGCDGYLSKPVNQQELIATLARLHHEPIATMCPSEPSAGEGISEGGCSELDLEDAEIANIVSDFVGRLNEFCAELHRCFLAGNWKGLAAQAHLLKGTAAMTGFPRLSQLAEALEPAAAEKNAAAAKALFLQIEELCAHIRAASQSQDSSATAHS